MKVSIFGVFLITMGFVSQSPGLPEHSPPSICYSRWFDRDNPSGLGDYETLANLREEYPHELCPKPLAIDAQTVDGVPASSTGQVFQYYNKMQGFACVNSQQDKGPCLDYKVRFGCPCPWPPAPRAPAPRALTPPPPTGWPLAPWPPFPWPPAPWPPTDWPPPPWPPFPWPPTDWPPPPWPLFPWPPAPWPPTDWPPPPWPPAPWPPTAWPPTAWALAPWPPTIWSPTDVTPPPH